MIKHQKWWTFCKISFLSLFCKKLRSKNANCFHQAFPQKLFRATAENGLIFFAVYQIVDFRTGQKNKRGGRLSNWQKFEITGWQTFIKQKFANNLKLTHGSSMSSSFMHTCKIWGWWGQKWPLHSHFYKPWKISFLKGPNFVIQ